jgi:Fe-S-cluster containining protein
MDVHFGCTQCGNCCRNLKLPLTVLETMHWLADGNTVQVICEAMPWPEEPPADDLKAAHRRRRSFATLSGSLPARVAVILAANFTGYCPNLESNMRCGIYDRRPLVCRIYPAEINPFVQLDPARKACPPEAWAGEQPLLLRDGRVMDIRLRENIQQSRDADRRDVEIKRRLCGALKLNSAALADEGFVVYSPDHAVLLAELARAIEEPDSAADEAQWHFISNRAATIDSLAMRGARALAAASGDQSHYEYLGFYAPSSGARLKS